jgi:hypothetical protein
MGNLARMTEMASRRYNNVSFSTARFTHESRGINGERGKFEILLVRGVQPGYAQREIWRRFQASEEDSY